MLTRRQVIVTGTVIAATGLPVSAPAEPAPELSARPMKVQLVPNEHRATAVWAYQGSVPGPVLRVAQGGRVRRDFVNRLPQPSTIHWHGIRIANAMDGVAGLTQQAVLPGERFLYDFTVPDAGTYWYHPHNRSWEQVARGLSGVLIVEEAKPPQVDAEHVLLIDDWRLDADAQIQEDFGSLHDWAHNGRLGNWITVNGNGAFRAPASKNQRLRLRLVNAANARIFELGLQGLEGWVVALDGQPLRNVMPADRLQLAPAQRADLIVDVTGDGGGEAFLVSFERDGGYAVTTFDIADIARPERLPEPDPLPANPVAAPGRLDDARRVSLRMQGGAMGGLAEALMGNQLVAMQDLAAQGRVWAMNGRADMPKDPLIDVPRGETVRMALVNDTAWPHAMHVHGHHFQTLENGGQHGPLRDTVLVEARQSVEIVFVADNPGDWLLHCHMLEHAAGGMTTWFRVAA